MVEEMYSGWRHTSNACMPTITKTSAYTKDFTEFISIRNL